MTTEHRVLSNSLTLAEIQTIVVQARAYRAEITREMFGKAASQLAALVKRLAAALRPSRHTLPRTGAWA